jgi:glutamate 5-kinase
LEDSADRRRYLNSRATLAQLLRYGVVPIVNENDTVATDEIRYGDNDRLAAQIAVTVGADHLVLLSDVDGFYSANPTEDATAIRFDTITEVTPEIERMAGDAGSGLSKGGMKTKLMAAKMAMGAGCAMAITLGSPHNPLKTLETGGNSTWFLPSVDPKDRAQEMDFITQAPRCAACGCRRFKGAHGRQKPIAGWGDRDLRRFRPR